MQMKFATVGNTLFLKDLLETSLFEELQDETFQEQVFPKENISYSPKFIRGKGSNREGYCEICNKWFKLKTSSYWYHMNYKHGINTKGERYPHPKIRNSNNKIEGYCEKCEEWIYIGKGKENARFSWLRHMQKKHSK